MEVARYEPTEYSLVQTDNNDYRLPPINTRSENTVKSGDGLSYTIGDMRYTLPPAHALRAFSEQQTGEIDSWPGSNIMNSSSKALALNNKGRLITTGTSLKGKLDTSPKPKFLSIIEDYLYNELKVLKCEETKPSDARLQVFREVFSSIIDDFKTYKPLLSAIKNEYEIMISSLNERIQQLEPLRQNLVLLSEQCDKKLMQFRKEEKDELVRLKNDKRLLELQLSHLVNEKSQLKSNIERLQEEVVVQYELYRKELDARKLLINDANDLRYQQEKRADDKEVDDQGMKKDDPIMMKIALKQTRKDLDRALTKLTKMEADYNDVVPRRDFLALEVKSKDFLERIKELQERNENCVKELDILKTQNETLKEESQRLQREKDDLSVKTQATRDEMTPRPEWSLCGEVIDGGQERWQSITNNKTSQEKLVTILNEFTGGGNDGDDQSNVEQLPPYGEGENVPFHLRSAKPIKNRRLTRRDVAVLITEIWNERRVSDKQNGRTKSLSEFIYEFFRNRFGNHNSAVEMAYNLDYACKKFKHNENCQLFHSILSGQADEDIYHHTKQLIEQLSERIMKESEGTKGVVSSQDLTSMLKKYLPNKPTSDISELITAAEKEQPTADENIDVTKLFAVDDEDNYGEFMRALKKQLNNDKQHSVNAKDLENTIRTVNSQIRPNELAHIVQWAFEAKDGSQAPTLSVNDIVQRLQNSVFYRQHTLVS
ncbi:unnamed protein product [Didymodactylos carnosus]|uniref:Translin-associated factor X-interacting protein 1 N-terminal domain-containing protein n=1 Tax=Didymodactylos carnosus TaxID=1234261 RepID=A0A814A7E8_9BILA|nr:unnamed protein product [Didymodactylos carnosus]CAF0910151.1 unnamed protein product [Didymodactylos carnosus]CAF3655945.1 unnamed protein product [Didymodactylos carnosus]CAF3691392.1 unnamed protein product [Didymodactylos carnosus]